MKEQWAWLFEENQLMLFSFVFLRISGFIFFNPILGRKNIPAVAKGAIIMAISIIVYQYSNGTAVTVTTNIEYSVLLLRELVIGLAIGFTMELFSMIFTYAGGLIDFQMGMSMATIYDAQNGTSIPLTGSFYNAFFILTFFAVDGHLMLMKLLIHSGKLIPFGQFQIPVGLGKAMIEIFGQCMTLAVKFAFPLLATQFLIEISIGILMKMIPQINIFVVNIQIKIVIGLLILILLFSPMGNYIENTIELMLQTVIDVLKMFAP